MEMLCVCVCVRWKFSILQMHKSHQSAVSRWKFKRVREDRKVITQYCTYGMLNEWTPKLILQSHSRVSCCIVIICLLLLHHYHQLATFCSLAFACFSEKSARIFRAWGVVHTANKLDRRWTLNVKCHKFPPSYRMQTFIIFHVIIITPHFTLSISLSLFSFPQHVLQQHTMNFKRKEEVVVKAIIAFRSKKIVNQSVCKKLIKFHKCHPSMLRKLL